jgi:hypothetical protein
MSLVTVVTVYGEGETETQTESAYPYLRSNIYAVKNTVRPTHTLQCVLVSFYTFTQYGISNI